MKSGKKWIINIDNADISISEEDVIIATEEKADYASAANTNLTVVLDCHLNQDLIREGHCRELVSKLQKLRRDS
ncbi:MAG: DUF5915 domain-containing protein, partial [Candidatus Peribacteria bacterium]|nr:DUF5915 domain-containing protein [Candidatus Peribacteria bacterium]